MDPIAFLKEVRAELAHVIWPNREQATQLTILVVVISIAVGVFTGGLDYLYTSAIDKILINK